MVNKNIDLKFRPKGNKNFSFFITVMHIFSYIHTKKRPAARAVGRFVFFLMWHLRYRTAESQPSVTILTTRYI